MTARDRVIRPHMDVRPALGRARKSLAGLSMLGAASVGCIDTQLDAAEIEVPCAQLADAGAVVGSMVALSTQLGPDYTRYCSAVVISTRLVLTTYTCVSYPGDIDVGSAKPEPMIYRQPTADYFEPTGYRCDPGGEPIEDGSFVALFGGIVTPEAMTVEEVGSSRVIAVDQITVAAASSRCDEGLAVLLLRDSPGLAPVPLRLDELDERAAGEDALMGSARPVRGRFTQRSLEMQVVTAVQNTPEITSGAKPSHLLSLTPSACAYERGAGIFSVASGALMALVAAGESRSCDDTTGRTLGVRLAPFRNLLLQTAAAFGQPLVAERRAGTPMDELCTAP